VRLGATVNDLVIAAALAAHDAIGLEEGESGARI